MAINIDNLIQTKKKFIIAGKEVEVIFNDDTSKLMSDTDLEISDLFKRSLDKEKLEEVNDQALSDQKHYVHDLFDKIKALCINYFDKIIAPDEGQRIYSYYDGSTQALSTIISIIEEHNEVYKKQQSKENSKKYQKQHSKKQSKKR